MKPFSSLLLFIFIITFIKTEVINAREDNKTSNISFYRQEMRDFVKKLSKYSKKKKPGFLIIPQNGHKLLKLKGKTKVLYAKKYLEAIDGIGQEDLFFGYNSDNTYTPKPIRNYLISILDIAQKNNIKVLVTDYCNKEEYVRFSYKNNNKKGYISFSANRRQLDKIPPYPKEPYNNNNINIKSLFDAKNFLYMINPGSYKSKEEFLNDLSTTNYDIIIIDLFFKNKGILNFSDISKIKFKSLGGARLIFAYMSIGEAEDYRYYWQKEWAKNPPPWKEKENPNWSGNYKVKYWKKAWQNIFFGNKDSYINKIIEAGFDGVYLDIIDAFEYFEEK